MVGSIGLNSIVLSNNLNVKNLACRHAVSFKSLPDTFQSVASSVFNGMQQSDIDSLISATQDLNPIDSGYTSKVFKIGDKVVKVPTKDINSTCTDFRDHIIHQNVKEYVALKRIEQIDPTIATKAHDVINHKGLYCLVEDFVSGVHPHKNKLSNSHVANLISNFVKLDINGLVNADLQPKNIFLQNDGTTKLIDFGSYMFLQQEGLPMASDIFPGFFFMDQSTVKSILEMPPQKKVANSFFANPVFDVKNKVSNPHLNLYSNLSNFEFRTLHPYLTKGNEEKPLEFFRNYVRTKGQIYHPQMRNFLKSINLEQDASVDFMKERLIDARTKLASAIDFEDVASIVLSNPTDDVLKAELAQIQLRILLSPENISPSVKNAHMLKDAYHQLDDILSEGLKKSDGVQKKYFEHCIQGIRSQSSSQVFDPYQVAIPKDKNLVEIVFGTASNSVNKGLNKVKNSNKKLWAIAAAGVALAGVIAGVVVFKNKKDKANSLNLQKDSKNNSPINMNKLTQEKAYNISSQKSQNNMTYINNPFANTNTPSVFSQFV